MRRFTAAMAVLVVGASLVAAIPGSALGDSTRSMEVREPPDLPEQWQQTYGEEGDDIFSDLVRTDDGGYLLVGWTERETTEGWVMKIDSEGEKEWEKTLGGSGTDRFWGVASTESGYLLAGRTTDGGTAGWVVEMSPEGEVRESRTTGSGAITAIARDDSDDNAGYLLAGWTNGDGVEGLALKLDEDLSREWQQSYQTPEDYENGYLRAVVPTEEGYYLAGKIEGDSDDGWALKVGSDGNLAWQKTIGGPGRDDVWAAAPVSADGADSGFVLAGETGTSDDRDGWLVKFGADGGVAWERSPGSDGTQWYDSAMRTDDGFLFTGSTNAGPTEGVDGYVLKTDVEGEAKFERYYATSGWDKPWPAIRAHGGGYLLAGQTSAGDAGGMDGWLVRIGAESATSDVEGETTASDTESGATPDEAADATDSAIQGETRTAKMASDADDSNSGIEILGALLVLAALLVALRR